MLLNRGRRSARRSTQVLEDDLAQATRTAETITTYLSSVIDATSVLYEKKLYGHLLTVVFATIDTLGLLDAPPTQTSATGDGFKRWVNAYLLGKPLGSVTAVDLWGARCAVLHSHSSKSDSSRSGKARQIQYFGGDKNSAAARKFVRITNSMEGGIHVAMHFVDF